MVKAKDGQWQIGEDDSLINGKLPIYILAFFYKEEGGRMALFVFSVSFSKEG